MDNKGQIDLPETITFRPRPGFKIWAMSLVGMPGIFAFGVWVSNTNDAILGVFAGYTISAIALIGELASVMQIIGWRMTLRLELDGFEFRQFGRRHKFRWAEADSFTAVAIPGSEYIMFSLIGEHHGAPNLSERLLRTGKTSGLVNYYGIKGEELAAIMHAFRRRAIGEQTHSKAARD